jgi:hypothetical protein
MQLRKEIEPQWDIAEKRYPEILKLILDYTDFCDENGDEEKTYEKTEDDGSFKAKFNDYLFFSNRYFEQFLALNFKTFKHTLFQNHQDKNGKRFDYSINEIVVLLWNDGKYR